MEREHILQWAIIAQEDEEKDPFIVHQFEDPEAKPLSFSYVQELGDKVKVLFLLSREQRIDSDEAIGSPFVAVDLENGEINVNGTTWDFLYPEIEEKIQENRRKKDRTIREARKIKEQEAYDEMVEKTKGWEDREAATEAARKAKKLSDAEYEIIDSMALDELELEKVRFRPLYFSTTEEKLDVNANGEIVKKHPPIFKYYKVGWKCMVDCETYKRVIFIDMETGKFLLRNER